MLTELKFKRLVDCVNALDTMRKVTTGTLESLLGGAYDTVICDIEYVQSEAKRVIERCKRLKKGGD